MQVFRFPVECLIEPFRVLLVTSMVILMSRNMGWLSRQLESETWCLRRFNFTLCFRFADNQADGGYLWLHDHNHNQIAK